MEKLEKYKLNRKKAITIKGGNPNLWWGLGGLIIGSWDEMVAGFKAGASSNA